MQLPVYQIDAFTDRLFGGNPACVVPLTAWPGDALLLKIARENAVPETAYFVPDGRQFELRWFTPEIEMDLCGHATLATAHVLKTILHYTADTIVFSSKSGQLQVRVNKDLYTLDFPSRNPVQAPLPEVIAASLSKQPRAVLKARDYVLVYDDEQDVRNIRINRQLIDQVNLDPGGIIITAKGRECDFVSRFFTTQAAIFEDPVTGSAHCSLIPYWSAQLNKKEMTAMQLSERQGRLFCADAGDRVFISGHARTYSSGTLYTE
ncbi:MAG TPA: PhzF family phenazine biosynthesis protein [Chitinophaga sp.]|uniref:PhzF family phenazine biosynthesis protein n=1 Tax=Chitinophaga sp. TaxID=1869181 RepID=UPI002DB7136F|nr:PhzF family phenazine biosynthesis protein [Chitinophaga sp.]HEU4552121.1 PhzF family phenazine biosynthesis protein [Chitinophaga sp.]